MVEATLSSPDATTADIDAQVIEDLGFDEDMAKLRSEVLKWIARCDEEIHEPLRWQFVTGSKYFRPLTIFSCHRAIHGGPLPPAILRSALVVEMFHNVSLIIDDILDKSEYRRSRKTLHTQFGSLSALMTSGYIVADGYRLMDGDAHAIRLLSELLKRLAVAECMQWRLRQQPLGVEDWRRIAGEDTGSMFEICACFGDRSEQLRRFGQLLGLLYHGCDDVGDIRGATALGGGGEEDLRDGILTLPAAFAIRDHAVAEMFCNPTEENLPHLATAFAAKLPDAERYLDKIAEEAREEARLFTRNPEPLLDLVDQTRRLSQR